ncbi:MAG: hypothetical protein DHS20C11_19990 [Lysobacteraceae bacterium]|nr:MAG: hypothetical protein DHS20C11_19990 [Xanthomonadaceae bacterium]
MSQDHNKDKNSITDVTQTGVVRTHELASGQVLADRYRIECTIGVGGMGTVYRAHDQDLDAPVAIKVLRHDLSNDPTAIERFRQELLLSRRVSHPNVVRLHDLVRDDPFWFITMDFIDGEPLNKRIDREGKLAVDVATQILRQVAGGLQAAHAQGIVHRDLKPANILVDRSGTAYVTDFGIARSVSHAGLTLQGVLVGTPDYLSPEQAIGDDVDHRSDLYALGLVLCEMLTGKLPFNAVTAEEAISQRLIRSPTPLQGSQDTIPAELIAICHRLLRRNVARRFQTAAELIVAIDGKPAGRRFSLWGAAAGLLLVVLLGYFGWQLINTTAPQSEQVAPVLGPPVYAVLPVVTDDLELGEALAAAMTSEIGRARSVKVIDRLAVFDVLSRLRIDPERFDAHVPRIIDTMGVDVLITSQIDESNVLSVSRYDAGRSDPAAVWTGGAGDLLSQVRSAPAKVTAIEQFDTPRVELSDNLDALNAFFAGALALEQGNAIGAHPQLLKATELDSAFTAAWWALGRAHAALGQDDEAMVAVRRAARLAGDGQGRYAVLARALGAEYAGDFELAEQLLASATAQYPHDLVIKTLMAEFVGEGGEFERAIELLVEVTDIDPERARAWFLLAKYSIVSGNARIAVDDYLVRALVINNRQGNLQGQADVVNAQGVAFDYLGQTPQAMEHFERAVRLRSDIGDRRGEASTLRNLAALRAIQGDFDQAQSDLARAQGLLQALGDAVGLAALHNDLGFLAEERGDYQLALTSYREALRLRQQGQDMSARAESYNNVGYCYYQLGEYDNALVYFQRALEIMETTGDADGAVHTEQQLGLLHLVRGDWSEAENTLQATLRVAEAQQMTEEYAVSSGFMAELDYWRGRYDAALNWINAAAPRFEEIGDQRGRLEMAMLAASILLDLGQVTEAQQTIASLQNADDGNREQAAKLALLLARLASAVGEQQQADDYLQQAKAHALQSANPPVSLAVEIERLRTDEDATLTAWVDLSTRAEALGHVGLQLRIIQFALSQALANQAVLAESASELSTLAANGEALLVRVGDYGGEPALWHSLEQVCQLEQMPDCQSYSVRRREAISRIAEQVPEPYREQWLATHAN